MRKYNYQIVMGIDDRLVEAVFDNLFFCFYTNLMVLHNRNEIAMVGQNIKRPLGVSA